VPSELLHVLARRMVGSRRPEFAAALMYAAKARFDEEVARNLTTSPATCLIAMNGAASRSFRAAKSNGGTTVLNHVNATPHAHNAVLRNVAGLLGSHHEMVPDRQVARIEDELGVSDIVLVLSKQSAKQLVDSGVSASRIIVVPPGIDPATFTMHDRATPKRASSLECLYVGQMSHRKGIPVLLEAARLCKRLPVRFRLIGPVVSPEVLRDLPDNVAYEGAAAPGRGVAGAMQEADVFLLPSLLDAFGRVVFEAMASGLPVIASDGAGASEWISPGRHGFVVPAGNAQALACRIEQLLDDPDLRSEMGIAGHAHIQQAYSMKQYAATVVGQVCPEMG
jgi:glycosyltransferase involved in cell wall biosynthesis